MRLVSFAVVAELSISAGVVEGLSEDERLLVDTVVLLWVLDFVGDI